MSETAKKEWNVGDAVWVIMKNPEVRMGVYQGTVVGRHDNFYSVQIKELSVLWYVANPYDSEREAVEDALKHSIELLTGWTEAVKRLTDRLIALTVSESNTTQTPVQS